MATSTDIETSERRAAPKRHIDVKARGRTGAASGYCRVEDHMMVLPAELSALRTAIAEMSARGLTDRNIGAALSLNPVAVRRLLATVGPEAATVHVSAWARPERRGGAGQESIGECPY